MGLKNVQIKVCDLCPNEKEIRTVRVPVKWTTEQNEGRCVEPYITIDEIDICPSCLEKITRVTAHGAQGKDTFSIIEDRKILIQEDDITDQVSEDFIEKIETSFESKMRSFGVK